MKNRIADEVRLKHILDAISDIEEFTFDKDFAEFNVDKMMQSACIHQLEIIGEAVNHLNEVFFQEYPNVE